MDRTLPGSKKQQKSILQQFMGLVEKSNDRFFQQQQKTQQLSGSSSSRSRSYYPGKCSGSRPSRGSRGRGNSVANMAATNVFSDLPSKIPYEFDMTSILNAKVPIVKLREPKTKTEIDISVLYNQSKKTSLMNYYVDFDSRVAPFLVCIKYWTKRREICGATTNLPNTFGFTLLAIKCLQLCQPPILPIMGFIDENDNNNDNNNENNIKNYSIPNDIIKDAKDNYGLYFVCDYDFSNSTNNNCSILELLIIFFEMYSRFDFGTLQISITRPDLEAKNLSQFDTNQSRIYAQSKTKMGDKFTGTTRFSRKIIDQTTMVVEDPVNKFVNVTRHVREHTLRDLKKEFERGYVICCNETNWKKLMTQWGYGQPILLQKKQKKKQETRRQQNETGMMFGMSSVLATEEKYETGYEKKVLTRSNRNEQQQQVGDTNGNDKNEYTSNYYCNNINHNNINSNNTSFSLGPPNNTPRSSPRSRPMSFWHKIKFVLFCILGTIFYMAKNSKTVTKNVQNLFTSNFKFRSLINILLTVVQKNKL